MKDEELLEAITRQRAADAAWLDAVRADGFEGALFDEGADRLINGAAVKVGARIVTGRMMLDSERMGRSVKAPAEGLRQLRACTADLDALTWAVVDAAWRRFFRDAIAGSQWRSDGGSTLSGYLLGTCTQEFKNQYQKWLPKYLSRSDVMASPVTMSELLSRSPSQSHGSSPPQFDLDLDAATVLNHLGRLEQEAALLITLGYSKKEAAAILGIGPKALAARLRKAAYTLAPHYPDWSSR